MKISKTLIKTIAVAVVVGTTTSCAVLNKIEQKMTKKEVDHCHACGMG
jgi:hypothetical protein